MSKRNFNQAAELAAPGSGTAAGTSRRAAVVPLTPSTPVAPATMDQTVVLEVRISGGTSNMRKVDAEKILRGNGDNLILDDEGNVLNADWASFTGRKCIIHRRYIRRVSTLDHKFRAWLDWKAIPGLTSMLAGGLRMIPIDLLPVIEEKLEWFIAERARFVEEDIAAQYAEIKKDARKRLAEFFNEADFPSKDELVASYEVKRRYLSFNAPSELERINKDIFEAEQQRVAAEWERTLVQVRAALRDGFKELVAKLADRLQDNDANGKPRRFTEATLGAFKEFLSTFDARNLSSDSDLQALVNRTKGLISGVATAEVVRENEDLRSSLASEFKQINKQVTKLATVSRGRRFSGAV